LPVGRLSARPIGPIGKTLGRNPPYLDFGTTLTSQRPLDHARFIVARGGPFPGFDLRRDPPRFDEEPEPRASQNQVFERGVFSSPTDLVTHR
jgi:hypothetical protein